MTIKSNASLSRRNALKLGAAGIATLAMPAIVRAASGGLKVGAYGGYFKDSFDKHIFPDFTKATGIDVESVAEPTGEAWLVQLEQASKAADRARRRFDDGAGAAAEGRDRSSCGRRSTSASCRTAKNLKPEFINKYAGRPRLRHRGGDLVHQARHQHEGLSGRSRRAGRRCGTRPTRTARACSRWSPTRSCSRSPPRPISAAPISCRARTTS